MSNNKRLERDLQNKVLGGVCSGLGNYFDLDPAFWRVLFFFLFFLGCSGLLIYIVLWIVMPVKDYSKVTEAEAPTSEAMEKRRSNGSMAAGLVLIAIGAFVLIGRYIPQINWHNAWPILLIALGIFLIIPFKNKKS